MGVRRVIGLTVLVAALGAVPAVAFADTYPPPVEATEVVNGDVTPPPVTDVDADQVVAPGSAVRIQPATDVLSTTGGDVLPMLLAALVLLLVGAALAAFNQSRRNEPSP